MKTSTVLLLCVLATCSVWAVQGRTIEVNIDDEEQADTDVSVEVSKVPGLCWACKWALNKVKKAAGNNCTVEKLKARLNAVCNEIGLLKNLCRKFVKSHLGELIEELTTTDDVRTICVNLKACKPKELLDLFFYPNNEDPRIQTDEKIKIAVVTD